MNSARVEGTAPWKEVELAQGQRTWIPGRASCRGKTHGELAVQTPKAVARQAGGAIAVHAVEITRRGAVSIEAAVGASPEAALPVPADIEVARVSRCELEAAGSWAGALLSCDAGPYCRLAVVGHLEGDRVVCERHVRTGRSEMEGNKVA